jgi:hypothetical protein
MTLTVRIDTQRWRTHQDEAAAQYPGLVPVVKGNGYGVGMERLAREAGRLGVDTVAVDTTTEAAEVGLHFGGRVLVLEPYHPAVAEVPLPPALLPRVIRVVATVQAAAAVPGRTPVVLELLTSLRRHGLAPGAFESALSALGPSRLAGFGLHFPLPNAGDTQVLGEVQAWVRRLHRAGALPATVWLSHVSPGALRALRLEHPDVVFRPRIGTQLWLGDPGALAFTATVRDVHVVRRGQRYGYRGRRAPWNGHLVVLSGGTAHGMSLQAPRLVRGLRARLALGAEFGLAELNWARSPYTVCGRRPFLAEPPHMHVSLVLLPPGVVPPAVGSEVPVRLRATTAHADRVVDC